MSSFRLQRPMFTCFELFVLYDLLFYNAKLRKTKKKKIENRAQNFENHHFCTKSKKTKHSSTAINWTCSKHLFRTSLRIFVQRGKFRNDWHGKGAASQLKYYWTLVHENVNKSRNFYTRMKPAKAINMSDVSFPCNSTHWWLIFSRFRISAALNR